MKKVVGDFIYAIMAGVAIAVGATSFLMNSSMDGSKLVGSVLFSVGLFAVLTLGWNLFTGKVGYVFENKPNTYIPFLIVVYIGNFVGSIIFGVLIRIAYSGNEKFYATAEKVAQNKINLVNSPLKLFVLAILCNFLVVFAVEQFRFNQHELGKYIGIVAGIATFVFLGFEHSIANMYYMAVADKVIEGLPNILLVTVGNIIGGVIVPVTKKVKAYCDR